VWPWIFGVLLILVVAVLIAMAAGWIDPSELGDL
jgi:hypothetical protein